MKIAMAVLPLEVKIIVHRLLGSLFQPRISLKGCIYIGISEMVTVCLLPFHLRMLPFIGNMRHQSQFKAMSVSAKVSFFVPSYEVVIKLVNMINQ